MEILERIQFATETSRGADYAINKLLENASAIIDKFERYTLAAIGISCGGPLDSSKGLIQSPPNLPGWDNIPITQLFESQFNVPVFLQNDANACALAEFRFGAGRGTENMIFLTFGTGLGAGLILNGRIYTGTNDLAGEVGHIRLADDGPEGFGKHGSFEGFCSGAGIARLGREIIRQKMKKGEKVSLIDGESQLDKLSTKDLAMAAAKGDQTAIEIFEISGRYLGIGLSILIDTFNPQRIVIGGVYARNPHLFEKTCNQVIEKEAIPAAVEVCKIVPAALGDQVGDYASLSVAMMGEPNQNMHKKQSTQHVQKGIRTDP
jgi:glucokinase